MTRGYCGGEVREENIGERKTSFQKTLKELTTSFQKTLKELTIIIQVRNDYNEGVK